MPDTAALTVSALAVALAAAVASQVNRAVTEPYMDEIFHVPQAQHYCRGDYGVWDSKITTLPGLYLVSVALIRAVPALSCSLATLRAVNALLWSVGVVGALVALTRRLHPAMGRVDQLHTAINVALFPVAFFHAFLYYTDIGGELFVLLSLLFMHRRMHVLSALAGTVAIGFRQTNVVWVAWVAAVALEQSVDDAAVGARRRLLDFRSATFETVLVCKHVTANFMASMRLIAPYAATIVAFCFFVFWNGGIVVGDKDNHQPVLHVPQLFYFVAFAAGFLLPTLILESGPVGVLRCTFGVGGSKVRDVCMYLIKCVVAVPLVHRYTQVECYS